MSLPIEVLTSAMVALEEAVGQSHRVRQEDALELRAWRAKLEVEPAAASQVGVYCLQHSGSVRARFFGAKLLEQALPTCLLRGLMPSEQLWALRSHLLQCAIDYRSNRDTRVLTSAILAAIATLTVAGFAYLPVDDAFGGSHQLPGGFSMDQRQEVVAQIETLLLSADDPGSRNRCMTGLGLMAELIDRFDDRNALGAFKPRTASGVKILSWPEMKLAKTTFGESVLPRFTSILLHLLHVCVANVKSQREILEAAISNLSAALEFHHDSPNEESAARLSAFQLPGMYGLEASGNSFDEDSQGRMLPMPRQINPAMTSIVFQAPVLDLLRSLLYTLSGDLLAANGHIDDVLADEDDAALTNCWACIEALASFTSASRQWQEALCHLLSNMAERARRAEDIRSLARVSRTLLAASSRQRTDRTSLLRATLRVLPILGRHAAECVAPTSAPKTHDALQAAEMASQDALEEVCGAVIDCTRLSEASGAELELRQAAETIFSAYVSAKMIAARYQAQCDAHSNGIDEEVQAGIKDRDTASELLASLATIGRLAAASSLAQIDCQLNQLIARMLNLVHRDVHPSESSGDILNRHVDLAVVHEQTHWLILIAGHLLADPGHGETPAIPSALLQVSQSQVPANDSLLQISDNILHLFRNTSIGLSERAAEHCSPQIAEDLCWFIGRWSLSYLLTSGDRVCPLSSNLTTAYHGDAGLQILHHLFRGFRGALLLYAVEDDPLLELGDALTSMSRSRTLCEGMIRLRSFAEFVESVLAAANLLSSKATAALWSGILCCVSNCLATSEGSALFDEVVKVIEARLREVVEHPDFLKHATAPPLLAKMNSLLDTYAALTRACQPASAASTFTALSTFCPVALRFIDLYRNAEDVLNGTVRCLRQTGEILSQGLIDLHEPQAASVFASLRQAVLLVADIVGNPSMAAEAQRDLLTEVASMCDFMLLASEDSNRESTAFLSSALAALCGAAEPGMLTFPEHLTCWTKLLRTACQRAIDQVEIATAEDGGTQIRIFLTHVLTAGLRSVNADDVRISLEAAEAMALGYIDRHSSLVHLREVLEAILLTLLSSLCFEPCSAAFLADYLHITQLALLGLSRGDSLQVQQFLLRFVHEHSARAAHLGLCIDRLANILTQGDALTLAPGARNRSKLAQAALDAALDVLRDLRMEVRL